MGFSAYRDGDRDYCKAFVSWAYEDDVRTLDRADWRRLDTCERALRSFSAAKNSIHPTTLAPEIQLWLADRSEVKALSAADIRAQLLALTTGVANINGVPVKRIPCAGAWFDVGVCEDNPDIRWQRLRLVDAVSRCKSGYFPRLRSCFSGRDQQRFLDEYGLAVGLQTVYEDTPEWHYQTELRHALLVDGEDPAWVAARSKWLGVEVTCHDHRVSFAEEASKVAMPVDCLDAYASALVTVLHGHRHPSLQQPTQKRARRRQAAPLAQMALW